MRSMRIVASALGLSLMMSSAMFGQSPGMDKVQKGISEFKSTNQIQEAMVQDQGARPYAQAVGGKTMDVINIKEVGKDEVVLGMVKTGIDGTAIAGLQSMEKTWTTASLPPGSFTLGYGLYAMKDEGKPMATAALAPDQDRQYLSFSQDSKETLCLRKDITSGSGLIASARSGPITSESLVAMKEDNAKVEKLTS